MKPINLEEFLKMLTEDNSDSGEEFLKKILDKAEEMKRENIKLEEIKQGLHKNIDDIKTEKDLQYFCYKMGMIVFDYFKYKMIGEDE